MCCVIHKGTSRLFEFLSTPPPHILFKKTIVLLFTMASERNDGVSAQSLLEVAAAANDQLILERRTCDSSYKGEWKRFTKWVDDQSELSGPPYIVRINVDSYYTRVVASRKGTRNHIGRVANAINWYARNNPVEKAALAGATFTVRNATVERALEAQRAYNNATGGTGNPGSDPQKGLKDNLPMGDRLRIMRYIYDKRADWGSCSVNITWGQNGAIRGASNRKLTYADIKISHGYGAENEGPLSRSLILVLRKGDLHKNRSDRDHQVACWRHKNYLLCSIFSTAAYLIWSINQNTQLNFLKLNKSLPASWWATPLIDWDAYSDASNAMKAIFDGLNLSTCKVTHFRTWAVQFGGFHGLRPDQINTMTDHRIEKQYSAYGPVAEFNTCAVMAGFVRGEPYHCHRALIKLEHNIEWYLDKLLPRYRAYKKEYNDMFGDKSEMCFRFLFELLPWLVEVLVQDGIFFIRDFPHHCLSLYLKVSGIINN